MDVSLTLQIIHCRQIEAATSCYIFLYHNAFITPKNQCELEVTTVTHDILQAAMRSQPLIGQLCKRMQKNAKEYKRIQKTGNQYTVHSMTRV